MHIGLETTDNADCRANEGTHDGAASLRDELAAQLAGAQSELASNIIQLRQAGASADIVAQGELQLAALSGLQRKLGQATPATVAAIRGEVAACVAAATKIAQQAQTAEAGNNQGLQSMSLASASQAARITATSFEDDFYGKKIFDPYLKFSSPEDEEKYRLDEAKRKQEIDKALALNTPEGNLRALTLEREQLQDAGKHGADKSPDYQSKMDEINVSLDHLAGAIKSEKTTQIAPSDKQTHQTASASVDPLDAIAPALQGSQDAIAALKSAGVIHTAQGNGHGLAGASVRQSAERSPT